MSRRSIPIAVLLMLLTGMSVAAPYVPADDSSVLEQLPSKTNDPRMRELWVLRLQLAQRPDDLRLAVFAARRYVEFGRATGDPRYAGYAQAALSPWWKQESPPRDVLVLRATLRQRVHDFDAALADLDRLLATEPRDLQALLTRATVLQVTGEYERAQADCDALQGLTHEVVPIACRAAIDAVNGRSGEGYARLRAALGRDARIPPSLEGWVVTALAEMAARGGRAGEARVHFRRALELDTGDQYLLAAYADFLLDQKRPREVLTLLREHTRADGLLLRYALALAALREPEAGTRSAELRARFDAGRRRGDAVHLREEARFALHLEHDAQRAASLAAENWRVQKEPADFRVLVESALAANDASALSIAREWHALTGLEDPYLAGMNNAANPMR